MAVEMRKDFAEMMRLHQQDVLELESQRRCVRGRGEGNIHQQLITISYVVTLS